MTFTGQKFNITNTASADGSLIADWQIGGVSVVSFGLGTDITHTGLDGSLTIRRLDEVGKTNRQITLSSGYR